MNYPCEIIADLLPLCADEVCGIASREAVEEHIAQCDSCRALYEKMKKKSNLSEKTTDEDFRMTKSLKKIKKKLGRRIKISVLASLSASLVLIAALYTLFNVPLKNVSLEDVSVSAAAYPIASLEKASFTGNGASVVIRRGADDESELFTVTLPDENVEMTISENTAEECEHITAVIWESRFSLSEIKSHTEGNTLYVSSLKTTFLNNKAEKFNDRVLNLEFRRIDKIVFADGEGNETVLWEARE